MATYLAPPKSLTFSMHNFRRSLFYGYINDTTLTVTQFDATDLEGLTLGATVAGIGVTLGTYVTAVVNANTFTVSSSQTVGSSGTPITLSAIPTSLQSVQSSLQSNEYLIRGSLSGLENFSALIYNPGTQTAVIYYDAYNVVVN